MKKERIWPAERPVLKIKKRGGPRPNSGGKRAGAGRKAFAPTDQQRMFVKLLIGIPNRPYESICSAIINPLTKQPISVDTFAKAFAEEIRTARIEMDALLAEAMAKRVKAGSDTQIIWQSKNRWGWRDRPEDLSKVDPVNTSAELTIRVVGGLPHGSTPDNPGGVSDDETDEADEMDETVTKGETVTENETIPAETITPASNETK